MRSTNLIASELWTHPAEIPSHTHLANNLNLLLIGIYEGPLKVDEWEYKDVFLIGL